MTDPLSTKPGPKKLCIACKRQEAPGVGGANFSASGDNGMVIMFWMCTDCALEHSPGQGPITLEDPTTRV